MRRILEVIEFWRDYLDFLWEGKFVENTSDKFFQFSPQVQMLQKSEIEEEIAILWHLSLWFQSRMEEKFGGELHFQSRMEEKLGGELQFQSSMGGEKLGGEKLWLSKKRAREEQEEISMLGFGKEAEETAETRVLGKQANFNLPGGYLNYADTPAPPVPSAHSCRPQENSFPSGDFYFLNQTAGGLPSSCSGDLTQTAGGLPSSSGFSGDLTQTGGGLPSGSGGGFLAP